MAMPENKQRVVPITEATMSENKQAMIRGELYHAFTPEIVAERRRCAAAVGKFNRAIDPTRREHVQMIRNIIADETPMPPQLSDPDKDEELFTNDPWIDPPVRADYGYNLKFGSNVYINSHATFIDTSPIMIGSRTLFGPGVHVYSGSHPVEPEIRNGTQGPEWGKPITIGEDCWIGGQSIILPGVNIGRGSTVGAGSVVTKDVPPFHIVAGNPARIIRKIRTDMDPEQKGRDPVEGEFENRLDVLMKKVDESYKRLEKSGADLQMDIE